MAVIFSSFMFHLLLSVCYIQLDSLLRRLSNYGQECRAKTPEEKKSKSICRGRGGKWCKLSWKAQIKAPKPRSILRLTLHCESLVQQQELFKETRRFEKSTNALHIYLVRDSLTSAVLCADMEQGWVQKKICFYLFRNFIIFSKHGRKAVYFAHLFGSYTNPTSSGCRETHVTTSWQLTVT